MLIKVLLADDHALVRAGFAAILRDIPGVEVLAEAADGRQALQLVKEHQPDIVLMDIGMPGLNGIEATACVARDYPAVAVIILSMHTAEEYVLQALHAGALGYLIKDADPDELKLAVQSVAAGEMYLSPAISRPVIEAYLSRTQQGSVLNPFQVLTPRQRQVLQLIAEGHSSQDIAGILNISLKTVGKHRYDMMDRLDIHDLAGLVRYALRTGLVSPE
ncbi:MAG: response regulator transcription factor [Chloroflexota bacterium]